MGEDISADVNGHHLRLITVPADRLQIIFDTIDRAETSLSLLYYIFAGDNSGLAILLALVKASIRGVDVCLIIDGFGSQDTTDKVFASLIAAGGRVFRFNPHYGRRYLLRNHQKMLIADKRVALIGGCNVSDEYFIDADQPTAWQDIMLRLDGPAAARLNDYFFALTAWTENPDAKVWQLRTILSDFSEATGPLRWLHGGLFPRLSPLTRAIRYDIDHVRKLSLVEAFFAPNWAMLRKLGHVVQRGGQCTITTAGLSNNNTTVAASRHCYRRLLSFGVNIQEYVAHRMHTKLIVADDAVYIGSANFDARSLYINVEMMLRIESPAFATLIRTWLAQQLPDVEHISPEVHAARGTPLNRLRWLIAYFIVSTLDYRLSRRLNISDKH